MLGSLLCRRPWAHSPGPCEALRQRFIDRPPPAARHPASPEWHVLLSCHPRYSLGCLRGSAPPAGCLVASPLAFQAAERNKLKRAAEWRALSHMARRGIISGFPEMIPETAFRPAWEPLLTLPERPALFGSREPKRERPPRGGRGPGTPTGAALGPWPRTFRLNMEDYGHPAHGGRAPWPSLLPY